MKRAAVIELRYKKDGPFGSWQVHMSPWRRQSAPMLFYLTDEDSMRRFALYGLFDSWYQPK